MPHRQHHHRHIIGQLGCWRRRRRINAWFDLTDSQREAVQRHAQRCAACTAKLEQMLALQRQLSATRLAYQTLQYPHASPPAHVRAAWAQRDQQRARPSWSLAPAGLVAAFTAVLLVLLVSQYMPSSLTPPDATRISRYRALPPRPSSPQPVSVANAMQAMRRHMRPSKPHGLALRMPKRPRRRQATPVDHSLGTPPIHKAMPA